MALVTNGLGVALLVVAAIVAIQQIEATCCSRSSWNGPYASTRR